jgi:hypothetical protein
LEKVEETQIEQPLVVDLHATKDRACVQIVFRSDRQIPMSLLIPALETYAANLRKQFQRSPIEVPDKKIVAP